MVVRVASTEDEVPLSTGALEARLSDSEWEDLSGFIRYHAGIKLSEAKRVFLVSRLLKRLRATRIRTFREYYELVVRSGVDSDEHQQLINAVTTNKTEFFREREHFEVLARWLRGSSPEVKRCRSRGLNIWCAATSTGEEPYTLAVVLREILDDAEWARTSILASDIDTAVLASARRAVYDESSLEAVDRHWRMQMFVRGRGDYRDRFRVRRELRERVEFFQLNLMQQEWPRLGPFDAIFCRNVLIYFDRKNQEQVVGRLLQRLAPHGLLFLGHAECLNGFSVATRTMAHSVYAHAGSPLPTKLSVPRLASSPASTSARAQSAVSRPSVANLAVCQGMSDASGWVRLRLDTGFVLLLYVSGSGVIRHSKESKEGPGFVDAIVRQAFEAMESMRSRAPLREPIRCKLIVGPRAADTTSVDVTRLGAELSGCGIELVAIRQVEASTELLVHASSGRIRLLHASSARRST